MASTINPLPSLSTSNDKARRFHLPSNFVPPPRTSSKQMPHRLVDANANQGFIADVLKLQSFRTKPRVFILSDIGNEPDDAESLCRYLLYANQFDTEGLVACTSTWLRDRVCPERMESIIDAYGDVVDNLNTHVHPEHQYPSAQSLKEVVRKGAETYGMSAVGDDIPLSPGAELLFARIIAPSLHPLWVLCWGGTNTLASVLLQIDRRYAPEDAARLMSRLRVYAISDQDDTGAWIRTNFSDVFYISSVHGWNQYGMAAWTGISGEEYYGFDQGGPDSTKVSKQWIRDNVQVGPLGTAYPDFKYIPEGDTPTFLFLVQNGLGISEFPDYGSWGGRYTKTDASAGSLNGNHYSDTVDRVKGNDGRIYTSNHATIWRWRDAFQNDFAARMKWTITSDFARANHHPVISVNDSTGITPVRITADAGSTVTVNASKTYDPDGDELTFKWWHYKDPTANQWLVDAEVADLLIENVDKEGRVVNVTLPEPGRCGVDWVTKKPMEKGQILHLILEVTDSGTPALTTYRRILIQCMNKGLVGPSPPVERIEERPVDEVAAIPAGETDAPSSDATGDNRSAQARDDLLIRAVKRRIPGSWRESVFDW